MATIHHKGGTKATGEKGDMGVGGMYSPDKSRANKKTEKKDNHKSNNRREGILYGYIST